MNELRRFQRAGSRLSPTHMNGDVPAAAQIEGDDGIAHGQFDRHVSGDNRDGPHVDEWVADREDQRNRIIRCRIGVNYQASTHELIVTRQEDITQFVGQLLSPDI
jgi:hypothetical protein